MPLTLANACHPLRMFVSPISTPVLRTPSYRPIESSPLASQSTSPSSPSFSSPLSAVQARRKSRYKTMTPSSGTAPAYKRFLQRTGSVSTPLFGTAASTPGQSQKESLRQRVQTRYLQFAAMARESAVKWKRHTGSDNVFGDAVDDDKEETEDKVLKDEVRRRLSLKTRKSLTASIVLPTHRRACQPSDAACLQLSYANEVGSFLDPGMEDLGAWEDKLYGTVNSF